MHAGIRDKRAPSKQGSRHRGRSQCMRRYAADVRRKNAGGFRPGPVSVRAKICSRRAPQKAGFQTPRPVLNSASDTDRETGLGVARPLPARLSAPWRPCAQTVTQDVWAADAAFSAATCRQLIRRPEALQAQQDPSNPITASKHRNTTSPCGASFGYVLCLHRPSHGAALAGSSSRFPWPGAHPNRRVCAESAPVTAGHSQPLHVL